MNLFIFWIQAPYRNSLKSAWSTHKFICVGSILVDRTHIYTFQLIQKFTLVIVSSFMNWFRFSFIQRRSFQYLHTNSLLYLVAASRYLSLDWTFCGLVSVDVWLRSSSWLLTSDRLRNIPHHSLDALQHDLRIVPTSASFLQDLHLRVGWRPWLINSVKQSYDLRVVSLPHWFDTYDTQWQW